MDKEQENTANDLSDDALEAVVGGVSREPRAPMQPEPHQYSPATTTTRSTGPTSR